MFTSMSLALLELPHRGHLPSANREISDAKVSGAERHDRPGSERLDDRVEVGDQKCRMDGGRTVGDIANVDHRRFRGPTERKQHREVRIRGDDHGVVEISPFKDLFVLGGKETMVANMRSVVPRFSKCGDDSR